VDKFSQLLRWPAAHSDVSSPASDRIWTCWVLGDAERARQCSSEALRVAERFGSDHSIVYALAACGVASCLALRWEEADGFFERARQRIAATGAGGGGEWGSVIHRARVLRMIGGPQHQHELEAQVAEAFDLFQRADMKAWFPLVLIERAGLARLRGDADGMTRDLAEARRLFAEMGVTGWDAYARSIEA